MTVGESGIKILSLVMAGLDPAIHVLMNSQKEHGCGASPRMT
jgi:hypothetical protein